MKTSIKPTSVEKEKAGMPLYGWLRRGLIVVFWTLNWSLTGLRTHWGFPLWLGYYLTFEVLSPKS